MTYTLEGISQKAREGWFGEPVARLRRSGCRFSREAHESVFRWRGSRGERATRERVEPALFLRQRVDFAREPKITEHLGQFRLARDEEHRAARAKQVGGPDDTESVHGCRLPESRMRMMPASAAASELTVVMVMASLNVASWSSTL